jgi:hypothetical protein
MVIKMNKVKLSLSNCLAVEPKDINWLGEKIPAYYKDRNRLGKRKTRIEHIRQMRLKLAKEATRYQDNLISAALTANALFEPDEPFRAFGPAPIEPLKNNNLTVHAIQATIERS